MRKIELAKYLTVEEIECQYRHSAEGVGRSQWQIIWLLAQGRSTQAIRDVTGYSLPWIRTLARRYNAEGVAGIGDKRHANRGRQAALTNAQQRQLRSLLEAALARQEAWSGREVAAWMSQELGRAVHVQRGYAWLAKLGYSSQVPRPHHAKAAVEDQRVFKNLPPSHYRVGSRTPRPSQDVGNVGDGRASLGTQTHRAPCFCATRPTPCPEGPASL